jgi:6-phosphogluconolactonase (cycloisomerase 2 family)
MLNRRNFTGLLGATALPGFALSSQNAWAAETVPFYASVGPRLTLYNLDVATAELTPVGSVALPANVQYAWPHPSRKFLYVAASNSQPGGGPTGAVGADKNHYALAFKVDPVTGALTPHGEHRLLQARPLHISTDHTGAFLFIAYNVPSQVTVHRLNEDGSIGDAVEQKGKTDFGIYAHQVLTTPGNRTLTLCSRGNDAAGNKAEDPGHIEVLRFSDGQLANLQTVTVGDGLGFGPRHLDFHPNAAFAYVSMERENALYVYQLLRDGTLSRDPLYQRNALTDPDGKIKHPGQGVGPIHVHPNGRFVYQTNRGSGTVDVGGRKVSNGGENNVVVWAIDPATGEPTLIQRAWTDDYELRTFAIDPSGRVLIAASTTPMQVQEQGVFSTVSAGLSVYRVGADGKLTFVHKYDVDTAPGTQFWCGLLTMA